jgi:hypothetical protein
LAARPGLLRAGARVFGSRWRPQRSMRGSQPRLARAAVLTGRRRRPSHPPQSHRGEVRVLQGAGRCDVRCVLRHRRRRIGERCATARAGRRGPRARGGRWGRGRAGGGGGAHLGRVAARTALVHHLPSLEGGKSETRLGRARCVQGSIDTWARLAAPRAKARDERCQAGGQAVARGRHGPRLDGGGCAAEETLRRQG